VRRPRLFLLDEPLSNLDAPLRLQLRGEIARVRRRLRATMLFVTHDQTEAMALADRVAVMKDGAAQQAARPMELYTRPANRFVAGFFGSPPMNFFEGALARRNGVLVFQERAGKEPGFCVELPNATPLHPHAGRPLTLGLRPEHILAASSADGPGVVAALLERTEPTGAETLLYYTNGNHTFTARRPGEPPSPAAQTAALRFNMEHARFFDPTTGAAVES
jgi:multiple sugar transport system ATP-binding protein